MNKYISTSNSMVSIARRLETRIRNGLSEKRLNHVEGVVRVSLDLAESFGVDTDVSRVAALAHDMDREMPKNEMMRQVQEHGISVTETEMNNPKMLHGPLAAWELEHVFGTENQDLLCAVRHHTLGHPTLGPVGWVLFIADYVEPGRLHLSEQDRSAILDEQSLPSMVCAVVDHSRQRHGALEPPTKAMYEDLKKGYHRARP